MLICIASVQLLPGRKFKRRNGFAQWLSTKFTTAGRFICTWECWEYKHTRSLDLLRRKYAPSGFPTKTIKSSHGVFVGKDSRAASAEQFNQHLVKLRPQLVALIRPRDITYLNLDAHR